MSGGGRVPYAIAADFERALGDLMAQAATSSSYGVPQLRRHFAYGCLLARVFTHQPSLWVLKGAAGLLARLPGRARHSIDIDLYFGGQVEAALDALREAAALDLGDFFTFDVERGAALTGAAIGMQLRVAAYLGDKVFERFRVDVAVVATMTGEPEAASPFEPVRVPGLPNVPYRVYPLADQVADKVAAMAATYAGQPSSRYRDLVDLVLIATTQSVSAGALRSALLGELGRRGLQPDLSLELPTADWPEGFRRIATGVPGLMVHEAAEALDIVRRLIEPVLAGLNDARWDPKRRRWQASVSHKGRDH